MKMMPSRRRLIELLIEHDGALHNDDGLLTAQYALGQAVLRAADRDGLITREMRGKRTYGVAINWKHPHVLRVLEGWKREPLPVATSADEPSEDISTCDGLDYGQLAQALLAEVVRAIAGTPAVVIEQEERLRDLNEQLAASRSLLAQERDRADQLERNLMAAMDAVRDAGGTKMRDLLTEKEQRQLDALMRSITHGRGA